MLVFLAVLSLDLAQAIPPMEMSKVAQLFSSWPLQGVTLQQIRLEATASASLEMELIPVDSSRPKSRAHCRPVWAVTCMKIHHCVPEMQWHSVISGRQLKDYASFQDAVLQLSGCWPVVRKLAFKQQYILRLHTCKQNPCGTSSWQVNVLRMRMMMEMPMIECPSKALKMMECVVAFYSAGCPGHQSYLT